MSSPKATQPQVSQAIDATKWATGGDDGEAAAETRKRARLCGPDAVAFLAYVMRDDKFASSAQRVRAASMLLEAAGFLTPEARETCLFRADGADGDAGREAT